MCAKDELTNSRKALSRARFGRHKKKGAQNTAVAAHILIFVARGAPAHADKQIARLPGRRAHQQPQFAPCLHSYTHLLLNIA